MFGDECVELLHRDRTPLADSFAFRRAVGAGVVAIQPPAFRGAGAQHHAPATGGANRQAGKQNWTCRHPRRLLFWLRACNCLWTCSNTSGSMMAGTRIATT